jgi:protein involved in polysaccharide export with SLBB domain
MGAIDFPLVGEVNASGRSVGSMQTDLQNMLSVYLRKPEITISILPEERIQAGTDAERKFGIANSYSVYIMGAVTTPGVYYLREPINPLQLIVRAGIDNNLTGRGYQGEKLGLFPDLQNITVVSEDGTVTHHDLSRLMEGKKKMDILKAGDTVIVSGHRAGTFAIYGEVRNQGVFEISQPVLLTEAIALGGGIQEFSDTKNIYILRGDPKNPQSFQVNLKDVYSRKNVDLLPVIQPGDTIYIPRTLLAKWYDFVRVMRGAEDVTENVENIRDHFTGRDIDRD